MSRGKVLAKNTIIIAIGKVCTQMITFLLLPLYTSVLTTSEYGIVDLLTTLISLLLPIVILQLDQAVFRNLIDNRNNEIEKKKIISTSIISILLQFTLYFVVFIILASFFPFKYKIFFATNVLSYVFSTLFLQISRGLGDNKNYAIAGFISAFSTILFNLLFLLPLDMNVEGMLLGTLSGQIICCLYLFFSLKLYKYFSIKMISRTIWKSMLKYSVPLIPNAISWWIFNASDRVIVSYFLGTDYNGILAAATKVSSIYISIFSIISISWTESISLNIKDNDIAIFFNKMFDILLSIFISLGILLIAFMPIIYPILINGNFIDGYNLVPILIVASLFNVVVGLISVIYVAKKDTKAIASTSIFAALCNIMVHLLLINYIGLYAAVISTFVSYFVMTIYRIIHINKKYFNIKYSLTKTFISILMYTFTILIYYVNNLVLSILFMFLSVIFSIYLNSNILKSIYNLLLKKGDLNGN